MEAIFVTERIILLIAPEDTSDSIYRPHIKEVSSKLQSDYGDRYFLMNVSEPRSDLLRLNSNVMDFGWPAALAPPLEKLCSLCKQADSWLNADPRNTLVVHCKGGLGRAGVFIAGYLHYTAICGSASQAKDRYAINALFERELQRHVTPSQRRFVQYFSGLLRGSIRICADPVYLHSLTLCQVPNFDGKASCRPSFKIYQCNEHVWTSDVYSLSESEGRNTLTVELKTPLQLRGDVMIKCHHHKRRSSSKELIFRCQLHTCAIEDGTLLLTKWDLDEACDDIRFPNEGRLELVFWRTERPYFDGRKLTASNSEDLNYGYYEPVARPEIAFVSTKSHAVKESDTFVPDVELERARADLYGIYQDTETHLILPDGQTYAKVNKKRSQAPKAHINEELQLTPPSSSLHAQDYSQLSNSFDSGISTALPIPLAADRQASVSKMERRAVSPGGTAKTVKFVDGLDTEEPTRQVPAASLRNGMDVVDLDAMQPELDELDRVFESLQAETESLDRMTSQGKSYSQPKPATKPPMESERESRREPAPEPAKTITRQFSSEVERSVPVNQQNGYHAASPTPQDSSLITGYVPHDRKGLAKKFGAFTFGLPTVKPELKSISSPPPVRRGSKSAASDTESNPEDLYGRSRLRPVQEKGYTSDTDNRRRAEEVLYNTAATSGSKAVSARQNGPTIMNDASYSTLEKEMSGSHYDVLPSQRRPYQEIPRMIKEPIIQLNKPLQNSAATIIDRPPSRPTSPKVPRPRTPTQEERLQRLLSLEEREYIVAKPDERGKPGLKEIAREFDTGMVSPDTRRNVREELVTESEGVQTDFEDEPQIPERKKQRIEAVQQTDSGQRPDADTWLRMQHEKLLAKRYGPDYVRRKNREQALLNEIKETQTRAISQVPDREDVENRLPLSSLVLREAMQSPPLVRKHSPENPGYAVVKKQITTSRMSVEREKKPEATAQKPPLRAVYAGVESDQESVADEVDFADEPLYKSPPGTVTRQSRSREINETRVNRIPEQPNRSFSNPASPDSLRKSTASPKSILKNGSLQRPRNATSEDRSGLERERATTPNFPEERVSTLQRSYSLYGTRERQSGRSTPTGYFGMGSRRSSLTSLQAGLEAEDNIIYHHPVFVRDLSRFYYKANITREEAIALLRDKPAGTFLIRDSNSYPGAYGLAVKVDEDHLPEGASAKTQDDLVRHFLIEPTPKGVHLKGSDNEPVFGSLPALVYQHSVTPLALPCKLVLPGGDVTVSNQPLYSEDNFQRLMETGAACNVFYLLTVDTESLTGPQAIRRAMGLVSGGQAIRPTIVHFKVNGTGITLTDSKRKLFFRRHYPTNSISFCGLDPDDRRWTFKLEEKSPVVSARCFGFVSRKKSSRNQNECHIFAELEDDQPAGAIVSFITKVMMSSGSNGR